MDVQDTLARAYVTAGQTGRAMPLFERAAEYQDQHGQPITRDALRARLGVSNQAASDMLRQLRAGDGSSPPGASRAA